METKTPTEAIAGVLREAAERKGITTSDLSRLTHIARETLRRKLAGKTEFTMGDLDALTRVLGLDLSVLVGIYAAARVGA